MNYEIVVEVFSLRGANPKGLYYGSLSYPDSCPYLVISNSYSRTYIPSIFIEP